MRATACGSGGGGLGLMSWEKKWRVRPMRQDECDRGKEKREMNTQDAAAAKCPWLSYRI